VDAMCCDLFVSFCLLFQPVARFPVDPIETYFFAQRRGRIERNGATDQRKPKIGPSNSHAVPLDTPKQYATGKLYRKL
jgi:hypothetical protein